jgi:hypothetical protein
MKFLSWRESITGRMYNLNDGQEVVLLRFFYRFPEGARLGLNGWKDIAEITLPVRP